ncbi:hypothetical protein FS837_007482 [Tulasnella sp. UAMH 9824]|nr:hypothetical protein FS837_007482 [Tulasnella sp. UAMH 9824]
MDTFLSPGVSLAVCSIIPRLIAPPAFIVLLDRFQKYSLRLPTALSPTASLIQIPQWLLTPNGLIFSSVAGTVSIALTTAIAQYIRERFEMWKLNATSRVPVVKGKLPGNVDVMQEMLRSFEEEYAVQFLNDNAEKHGYLYCLRYLGEDLIVTFNPNDIKRIMTSDFQIWEKGEKFHDPTGSLLGSGVFNSDGDMWKFHRNMTRPYFSRERITDFEIFKRHSDHAIDLIRRRCSSGEAIDFQDIAGRLTMDSATEFLFGRSVDSLSSPLPRPRAVSRDILDTENAFVKAFNAALIAVGYRLYAGGHWRLFEFMGDKTRSHMKVIRGYLDPIIDEALRKKKQSAEEKPDEEEKSTLLEHLVASTEDRTAIRDQLLNILLAGRDTTAHLITAIFYFLATQDKSIFKRLRQEALEAVGPNNPMPTFDQIKELRYLRAVINETLRLMPSVPANLRQANQSSVWVTDDGTRYYIPKGVNVTWSTIGLHRRKDLWGPDALVFDPDRWLDERNKKYYLANPFIYLPFHGGPRTCLGQQFALNEASFFVIRLLQAFDDITFSPESYPPGTLPPEEWKKSDKARKPSEKVHPKTHLTMYIKGGLWVHMREVGNEI